MALCIQQIACGENHSLVLLSDGSVWGAGRNNHGQLGDGSEVDKTEWVSVMPSGSGVVQVVAGGCHSLALKSDGSVWAAGYNHYDQLGDGTTTNKTIWTSVIPSDVIQVAAGGFHSLALKSDGSVLAAGNNWYGQLGNRSTLRNNKWLLVIPSSVVQISAGEFHSLALKSDGSVWAAGQNEHGQLGDGTGVDKYTWAQVMASGVKQVAAGGFHSLALKSDGAVWATGANGNGQLGDGTNKDKITWTSVMPSGSDFIQVSASGCHSLALKSDGSVWATGRNYDGQLGDGTTVNKSTWISVISSGVTQVASNGFYSFALKSDGTLWKTGENEYGQLGFEGPGSTVWISDAFLETLLLESLLIDPPRPRRRLNRPAPLPRKLNESKFEPDVMTDPADDWRGLSL